jgi:hypothetical protein
MQTTQNVVATTAVTNEREPLKLRERVGSTTYVVSVRFSQTSRETMQDKILRLIERDPLVRGAHRPGSQVGVAVNE